MPRLLAVVDGALKHQVYVSLTGVEHVDEAILTFWTWKAGGSPVGATRIAAEQAAIQAWCTSDLRGVMHGGCLVTAIRTWDYGLDPATRTAVRVFPYIVGNSGGAATIPQVSYVVALRAQAIGSAVRDRINGRAFHCGIGTSNANANLIPTMAAVQTAYGNLRSARLNGAGNVGTWSFVSYRHALAPRVPPLVTPVNHVLVQRIGTQRRRVTTPGPYARGA